MMGKGRIMHVLIVVCCLYVSVTHITAYPTGDANDVRNVNSDFPDYSPSYVFVDDYLRHTDQDLSPSNSDIGDLIWGILYEPDHLSFESVKRAPTVKRQHGWYVNYGKRSFSDRLHKQPYFGDKGLVIYTDDLSRPYLALPLLTFKMNPVHELGKRQQGWYTGYGKRDSGLNGADDFLLNQQEDLDLKPIQSQSHFGFDKIETDEKNVNKRQQSWRVPYGKRNGIVSALDERKRQQGWHTNYGK